MLGLEDPWLTAKHSRAPSLAHFSWFNHQKRNPIRIRLDRFYIPQEWRPHVLQQEIIPIGILSDHFLVRLELDFSEVLEGSPDASQFFRVNLDSLPACSEGLAKIWKLWESDQAGRDGLELFTHALAECKAFLPGAR